MEERACLAIRAAIDDDGGGGMNVLADIAKKGTSIIR